MKYVDAWCPFSRAATQGSTSNSNGNTGVNRGVPDCQCVGPSCAAWVWTPDLTERPKTLAGWGRCGLAPGSQILDVPI